MSAVSRSLRTASRSVRLPASSLNRAAPLALSAAKLGARRTAAPALTSYARTSSFSTSAARMGAPALPQEGREYDPEIKDIAQYVGKPIDSELAVSLSL